MWIVIDLGEPDELSQDIVPKVSGPFATEEAALEWADAEIDSLGGVSAVVRLEDGGIADAFEALRFVGKYHAMQEQKGSPLLSQLTGAVSAALMLAKLEDRT